MGIHNLLGANGIFICDECRQRLALNIDKETFDILKQKVNTKNNELLKCFICNLMKNSDEGLFLPPNMMADSIQATLDSSKDIYERYLDGKITCPECGKEIITRDKIAICECGNQINTKRYGKKIKMSALKKITLKQYIKYLRGKSTVP